MWRTQTPRKTRQIISAARQLATESAPPRPTLPPPIPPLPQKSGGFKFIKFLGLSLPVATGGVVGYAWYDPNFRKQLEDNVPYAREVFDNILPEISRPGPTSREQKSDVSSKIIEQASKLNVQEEIAKSEPSPGPSSSLATKASGFDTYRIAHCATKRNTERHCHETDEKHPIVKEDLYASYIIPTFEKERKFQQMRHGASSTDKDKNVDCGTNDKKDNSSEKDGQTGFPVESKSDSPMPHHFQIKNPYVSTSENERLLNERLLASKANPFHGLSAPEAAQPQGYHHFQLIEELLTTEKDDGYTDDVSSSTVLQKQLEPKLQEKRSDNRIDPSVIDAQIRMKEEDEKADNAALEVVIHKLLTNSDNLAAEAVKAQYDVAAAIRNHTKLLKQAMEDTDDILQKDAQWEAVAIAHKEREHSMLRANELVTESKKSIERLRDVISEGKNNKVTKQNPAIFPASKRLNDLLKDLGSANLQVRQAEAEANVMQKYKELVEKGKKQFQKEIESLMPSGKLSSGKKLSEDELNALIAHAHRRIEQLQKQIAEQMAMERQRLAGALEAQRQESVKITNAAVAEERLRLQGEFDAEKSKEEQEYFIRMETEVRKQLARQAAAHSDHLKDVLTIQQQELTSEFSRELNIKLLEEREKFQTEVAGWISGLRGIEAAVDARAASEKLARCAQDLWLACIALDSVIHFGNDDEALLSPLRNKVEAILNAGNKHPFVETVANKFQDTALDRGVNTEDELRQRFARVSRICRRLGLVTPNNNSLYKYLVSFLHSFVVIDNVVATSEKDEVDLTQLDNFDLLAHAQYWMEKGNLELALRFMCQLTGESRRAASDWINEARLLLETKQIAYTLTAYASATGLANTF